MDNSIQNNRANVDAHMAGHPESLRKIVNEIRHLILECDPLISEHIKWNSPSFYYTGEIKSSNAKEYPRDLLVINLRRAYALMIFPSGSKISIHQDIFEGDYADGRRMITIKDIETLNQKKEKIKSAVNQWISLANI